MKKYPKPDYNFTSDNRIEPINKYRDYAIINKVDVNTGGTIFWYHNCRINLNDCLFPNRIYLIIEEGNLERVVKSIFDSSVVEKVKKEFLIISELEIQKSDRKNRNKLLETQVVAQSP